MADYVTTDEVGYLGHEWDATHPRADLLVTAASRMFDNLTGVGVNYYQAAPNPAAYSTRTFYGNGTGYLPLDPYTALNPVNPVVVDAAYAYDIPTYVQQDGMLVLYGSYLERRSGWVDGVSIAVSANWGFASIPSDVSIACAHIALHLYRTADPAFATISNAEGAAARPITLPRIARDIVDTYKAKYMPGFAFV
jgi:hypothetical protein